MLHALQSGESICLLIVLHSEGSSPGRQGFKQFVSSRGALKGSIGGGVMEQKLVELAKDLLAKDESRPFLKHQVHKTNIEKNKSGMICSGKQSIAFYFLKQADESFIHAIAEADQTKHEGCIRFDEHGFMLLDSFYEAPFMMRDECWLYIEKINKTSPVYIIGGGHVSLALCRCLADLDFDITVYDDRRELNTLEENVFAKKVPLNSYDEIDSMLMENTNGYVVIMTTGYRSDLVVLRSLVHRRFRFIGVLGSKEKIRKLFVQLQEEGVSNEALSIVHAPIGLQINSRTPAEIAVSIAAQLIAVRNND